MADTHDWKSDPLLLLSVRHGDMEFEDKSDQKPLDQAVSAQQTAEELSARNKKIRATMKFEEEGWMWKFAKME